MVACTTGGLRPLTPLGTPPGVPQRPCLPLALPSHSLTPRSGAARGCSQLLLLWYSTTTMRVYHACTMHMPGSLRRAPASHASTRARSVANVCRQRLTRANQWANCPANCRIPAGAPHRARGPFIASLVFSVLVLSFLVFTCTVNTSLRMGSTHSFLPLTATREGVIPNQPFCTRLSRQCRLATQ